MGLTQNPEGVSMEKSESGILSGYETTLITRAEMSETALKALQDRLKHVIASFSGDIVLTEDWGKRKWLTLSRKRNAVITPIWFILALGELFRS